MLRYTVHYTALCSTLCCIELHAWHKVLPTFRLTIINFSIFSSEFLFWAICEYFLMVGFIFAENRNGTLTSTLLQVTLYCKGAVLRLWYLFLFRTPMSTDKTLQLFQIWLQICFNFEGRTLECPPPPLPHIDLISVMWPTPPPSPLDLIRWYGLRLGDNALHYVHNLANMNYGMKKGKQCIESYKLYVVSCKLYISWNANKK
jgi:hypothetical protein